MNSPDLSRSLRWQIAQALCGLYRFQTQRVAKRMFGGCPPETFLERELFGYKFTGDVSRASPQQLIYLIGERFIPEAEIIRSLLKPGMHVVDVGANIGYYVLLFASLIGPDGTIVAIEPSPDNLRELALNVARNALSNVEIVAKAAGNATGEIGIKEGLNSGVTTDERARFTVQQDRIDNIARGRVDFLKIDVEGYEGSALKGAERILSERRPILFCEVHPALLPQYGVDAKEVVRFAGQYYDKMTVYEPNLPCAAIGKMMARYAGQALRRVVDIGKYLEGLPLEGAEPFWLVCAP